MADAQAAEFEKQLAEIKELRKERDSLLMEVETLRQPFSEEIQEYKSLKETKKRLQSKYESKFWGRVETENNLTKIKEDNKVLLSKIEESGTATKITTSLETTLVKLKKKLVQVTQNRKDLEIEKIQLQSKLSDHQTQISENQQILGLIFHEKRHEINIFEYRLRYINNIPDVVLGLYGEIEQVKANLRQHSNFSRNLQISSNIHLSQIEELISNGENERKVLDQTVNEKIEQLNTVFGNLANLGDGISNTLLQLEKGCKIKDIPNVDFEVDQQLEDIELSTLQDNTTEIQDIPQLQHQLKNNHVELMNITKFQNTCAERLKQIETKVLRLRAISQSRQIINNGHNKVK